MQMEKENKIKLIRNYFYSIFYRYVDDGDGKYKLETRRKDTRPMGHTLHSHN